MSFVCVCYNTVIYSVDGLPAHRVLLFPEVEAGTFEFRTTFDYTHVYTILIIQ